MTLVAFEANSIQKYPMPYLYIADETDKRISELKKVPGYESEVSSCFTVYESTSTKPSDCYALSRTYVKFFSLALTLPVSSLGYKQT